MTKPFLFDSPHLLGFERTRALMERAEKIAAEAYPPYNIEVVGEDRIRIVLAVAGFTAAQLAITVEDNQLTIVGRRDPETEARAYLHRGIAARGFVRGFVLADGLEVEVAALEDGLLRIDAYRPRVEPKTRTIPIRTDM